MKIERILNIEDTMSKHIAIFRALKKCGITSVDRAENAEDGLASIEQAIRDDKPYDLLITDMHFSVNGKDDTRAGMYVIEELRNREINIPIVVCSSLRLQIDGTEGCIYYNERSGDLDTDVREMIEKVKCK